MADFLAAVIIRGVNSQHNFSFFVSPPRNDMETYRHGAMECGTISVWR